MENRWEGRMEVGRKAGREAGRDGWANNVADRPNAMSTQHFP